MERTNRNSGLRIWSFSFAQNCISLLLSCGFAFGIPVNLLKTAGKNLENLRLFENFCFVLKRKNNFKKRDVTSKRLDRFLLRSRRSGCHATLLRGSVAWHPESRLWDYLDRCPLLNAVTHFRVLEIDRPFPSSPPPSFQSEAKCEVFVMKISFHSYWNWI